MSDKDRDLLGCLALISFFDRNPVVAEWHLNEYHRARETVDEYASSVLAKAAKKVKS